MNKKDENAITELIERLCLEEGPDIFGGGYVDDYYISCLSDIARSALQEGVAYERKRQIARRRKAGEKP